MAVAILTELNGMGGPGAEAASQGRSNRWSGAHWDGTIPLSFRALLFPICKMRVVESRSFKQFFKT